MSRLSPVPRPDLWASGMSLRDYFAGQALMGLAPASVGAQSWPPWKVAEDAYEFADAMLKARSNQGEDDDE